MNTTELFQQAEHNGAAGWSWCLASPEQIRDLVVGLNAARRQERALVVELNAAIARLERIGELTQAARLAWIDHDRERERRLLEEIKKLAKSGV